MLNFRPILYVNGILLAILSLVMLVPAGVDVYLNNPDWKTFSTSAFVTAFFGITMILTNQGQVQSLNLRQAFVLTTTSWIVLGIFASLPFMFSDLQASFTDSFFESMSGLTTTGSTVMVGLDNFPPGILLWRALLQALGGIGIIVVAIAILPLLRIGGMQLFRTESSDKSDKALPRARQVATSMMGIYVFLIFLCFVLLWMSGLSAFDAICHALTSVSTAGFSTHDASVGYFNSVQVEMIIAFFMLCGALPFVLYVQAIHGRPMAIFRDSQVRWFLTFVAIGILASTYWAIENLNIDSLTALRYSTFSVISIITTSGFVSTDYSLWGSFAVTFFFLLMVVGGCTGSTTGGIKIFRYQILYQVAKAQIQHLIHPHGVFRPRFNNKPVTESASNSVLGFFILFAMCFQVVAVLLSFTGLDYITSMSAAATALANVGPGLGSTIGPSGTFASVPDAAKWILSFAMLIGRLELFTVLILFSPQFWKE